MWEVELEILEVLRAVQDAIRHHQRTRKSDRDHEEVALLRLCRVRARQLGDAFAWVVFQRRRAHLGALAQNKPVPPPQRPGTGLPIETVAQGLSGQGFGFPVLHDITTCLRIGDITFYRPKDTAYPYLSVEVKARYVGPSKAEDGSERRDFEVSLLSANAFDRSGRVIGTPAIDRLRDGLVIDTAPANRVDRQALRLATATVMQESPPGEVVTTPHGPHMRLPVERRGEPGWKDLRRLIRRARREGYAGGIIGGAFFYAVLYGEDGVSKAQATAPEMIREMVAYLVPEADGEPQERHGVLFEMPPVLEKEIDPNVLPFFLYDIPRRAIMEMFRNQLRIVGAVEYAGVVQRLRDEGFDATLRARPKRQRPAIVIKRTRVDEWGVSWSDEFHVVESELQRAAQEFRGLESVIALVRAASDPDVEKAIRDGHRRADPERFADMGPDSRVQSVFKAL